VTWPSRWHLQRAVRTLRAGGVVAYPTEAVYGLGCDPWNPRAVARLLALKGRPSARGLILIAAGFDQIAPLLQPLPATARRRVLASWPGPVTWIWPARSWVPRWLRGEHAGVAVRVTAHPAAAALCAAWGGPLVSTSANPSGARPARSALAVRLRLGPGVDCLLPGNLGQRSRPTAIRDAVSGATLRAG